MRTLTFEIAFWAACVAQVATWFGWDAPPSVTQLTAFMALMFAAHARDTQERAAKKQRVARA